MEPLQRSASLPLTGDELWLARLRRSVRSSVLRRFPAGHVLAGPGQPLNALHVVMAGAIALETTSPAGKRAMLDLMGPGDVVGLEALQGSDESHLVGIQVRAMVPSDTLAIPLSDLAQALERDATLGRWLATSMARRLRAHERALGRALSLPVRARLLDVLRELASAHGRQLPGGVEVSIPLSQDDLGALVGATRESVNRALRRLMAAGLVRRQDGMYVLPGQPGADQPGDRGFS